MYRRYSFHSSSLFAFLCVLVLAASPLFGAGNREKTAPSNEVVVWTYDSFDTEWGPGPALSRVFKEKTGITIKWVSHGDAGELLARLIQEGKGAAADLILGLDQNLGDRALDSGLLEAYRPAGAEKIFPELVLDNSWKLIPFDYSYFSFVYDSEKIPNPPKNLEELCDAAYARKIVLLDPRTSSPGLGLFVWVKEVYGDGWKDYWRRLSPSVLTIAEGWSSGYGLFTAGEAPLVLSYTTSPAYHLEYEGTDRYRAAIFTDGHPLQVETASLLVSAKNKANAKAFLDFMVSADFQNIIPLTNWMYPVIDIPLPASFSINPKSDKPLNPAPARDEDLTEWAQLMAQQGSR